MKRKAIFLITALILLSIFILKNRASSSDNQVAWWNFQSIDTMKYSRDLSREKLNDPSFDLVINKQVEDIASTGATHVAIATPYDEEFYPILVRWVNSARRHDLKVWFRGNWSGWEKWFEYPEITRAQHLAKTDSFIRNHQDLFEDGDIFTACPECENGGPGDPRQNGDVDGHRKFLIDEHNMTKKAFKSINKNVSSNYHSMNGDVARLVMNKETTKELGGIVTIDHYVSTPEKLVSDIGEISRSSGGKIVLGEFGAPIPDIHGKMTEAEQAEWVDKALSMFMDTPELVGLNYWTNTGSSTELWDGKGEPREVVEVITKYYNLRVVRVRVIDEAGSQIKNARISLGERQFQPDNEGFFHIPYFERANNINVRADGFSPATFALVNQDEYSISLTKIQEGYLFKIKKFLKNII